jgi:hypothetical protein
MQDNLTYQTLLKRSCFPAFSGCCHREEKPLALHHVMVLSGGLACKIDAQVSVLLISLFYHDKHASAD